MNLVRIAIVVLAVLIIAMPTHAQRVEVGSDTLAIYFNKGRSALSVDSLLVHCPLIFKMVDTVCYNPSLVIVIEASADATRWIADELHDALNAAIAEARGIKGRMLTEVAGFDDPFRVLMVTREHEEKGKEFRYIKIYTRTAPWISRYEFAKFESELAGMQFEWKVLKMMLAELEEAVEEDTAVTEDRGMKFGGLTLGLSTVPQSFAFTFGAQVHLNNRFTVDGQIGSSFFHNHQTVEDGKRVSAYGMYYHGSVTYWLKTFKRSRLGAVLSFSQLENDTEQDFDYLVKRRVIELGITGQRDWFAVRLLVGYGFDEFWWTNAVDYGWFPRVQLFTIFD